MDNKPKNKRKTTRKSTAKKTRLKNVKQAHGKDENVKFEPSTLDQVWGDTGLGKYNTFDLDVYKEKLDHLAKTDLQAHATKIGLVPIDNRSTLTQRLVREFKKHVNAFKPMNIKAKDRNVEHISPEIRKILEEGR